MTEKRAKTATPHLSSSRWNMKTPLEIEKDPLNSAFLTKVLHRTHALCEALPRAKRRWKIQR